MKLEQILGEATNHLGDKEYSTYASWKRAIKAAHPTATFRGDKEIGAAVVDGKDVGEWDGEVGCVYSTKQLHEVHEKEKIEQEIKDLEDQLKSLPTRDFDQKIADERDELARRIKELKELV